MFNPLAIGVTLGGLLLDVLVPRPKPRAGIGPDSLPSALRYRLEDTSAYPFERCERPPVASGVLR